MVTHRPISLAVLAVATLLVSAGPGRAQDLDWRRAGGPIFVDAVAAETPAGAATRPVGPATDRVPAPDQPYDAAVRTAAEAHGLDPKLLHALVLVESRYRADAVSPAGAGGLTQLMGPTAAELGVADRFDPRANLDGGAAYLARQVLRFGDLRLALGAYNAGPGRVARLGRVPAIPETRAYVAAVLDCYLALAAGRGIRTVRDCPAPEAVR